MNADVIKWIEIKNLLLILVIGACIVAGFAFMHSAIGLWSLVLAVFYTQYEYKAVRKDDTNAG